MRKQSIALRILYVSLIAAAFALVIRLIFGIRSLESILQVMGWGFIFFVPIGMGYITVALSKLEDVKKLWYRCFVPFIPVLIFFLITLSMDMEGLACWIMAFPVFLVGALVGGLIAGYVKLQKYDRHRFHISIVTLLPFVLSAIEQKIHVEPDVYKAYTFIEIKAAPEVIWKNVTRVPLIDEADNHARLTRFMGFPRPLRAELNYEGLGASREAIFDKGLIFHEKVSSYEPLKKMSFSIDVDPREIPPTTMDEHIVIGGKYFDVLNGTYELEKLGNGRYKLHLYSHFKLSTHYNFYASIWTRWIMKDIQQNILQVIRKRAEQGFIPAGNIP